MSPPLADPPENLYPFERPPWNRPWMGWFLAVAVLIADYYTPPAILFPILFIIPVLLVAWHGRLSRALSMVVLLCVVRIGFHFQWGMPWGLAPVLINAAIRWAVLSLLAVLTSRVAAHMRTIRHRVRQLEGMLPICGFCKDIRDDAGDWIKLENYISRHSKAQFTTGICPECAEKHYASYLEKRRGIGA